MLRLNSVGVCVLALRVGMRWLDQRHGDVAPTKGRCYGDLVPMLRVGIHTGVIGCLWRIDEVWSAFQRRALERGYLHIHLITQVARFITGYPPEAPLVRGLFFDGDFDIYGRYRQRFFDMGK